MTISKILVGTDFSDQADNAIHHAMLIGRKTGAEVVLVHALSMPSADYASPYPVTVPHLYAEQVDEIVAASRKRLEDERERIKGQGVEVSQAFIDDMPDRGIVAAAEKSNAKLIVVGTHGRRGLSRFLIGSIAQRVAHRATTDVLVAKSMAPDKYQRILVPTDLSEHSEMALQRAIQLIAPGGTIDLLHLWQLPGGSVTYWGKVGPGLRESVHKGTTDYGDKLIARFSDVDAKICFSSEEGDARHEILDRLDHSRYDLVVMGSHGRKGLNRVLLGSVAEAIVSHAKQSVYLAKMEHKS